MSLARRLVGDDILAINWSGASSIRQMMADELNIGNSNICISSAFDLLKK